MNASEIVTIVDRLQSTWPWAEWPRGTIDEWCDVLEEVHFLAAQSACVRARDTLDKPPSIAWFKQSVKAASGGDYETFPALTVGRETPEDREACLEIIKATKELLAAQKGREHNHKGPAPCQVCGGLVGTIGDQREVAS